VGTQNKIRIALMNWIIVIGFLILAQNQIYAISVSALTTIKKVSAELDQVLAQPVPDNPEKQKSFKKKIDDLLAMIQTLGDEKAITKYQGLVKAKEQAIDLAAQVIEEKNKNSALQDQITSTQKTVTAQTKQLENASKKLESVGLSLPTAQIEISDLLDEIDLVFRDFKNTATSLNLDTFEEKINAICSKALEKINDPALKERIHTINNDTLTMIHKFSLQSCIDGVRQTISDLDFHYQQINQILLPFLDNNQNDYDIMLLNYDYVLLSQTLFDETETIGAIYENFKTKSLQNNYIQKTLQRLDDSEKIIFQEKMDELSTVYIKITTLIIKAFETMNSQIDILMDEPDLAHQIWGLTQESSDAWYHYLGSLDLLEQEVTKLQPNFAHFNNAIEAIDIFEAFNQRTFPEQSTASPQKHVPEINTIIDEELFISDSKPTESENAFTNELTKKIQELQKNPLKTAIPKIPINQSKNTTALFEELKNTVTKKQSTDIQKTMDLEKQFQARIKKLTELESSIKRLATFETDADRTITNLQNQFNNLLYDKPNVTYSPHKSLDNYYRDCDEIKSIEKKIAKKMIDPKKTASLESIGWTEKQKTEFETKKQALITTLNAKKELLKKYGYDCAIKTIGIIKNKPTPINSEILALQNKISQGTPAQSLIDELEKDTSEFYFMLVFGIYKPINTIEITSDQKMTINQWCIDLIPQISTIIQSLEALQESFAGQPLSFNWVGKRIIPSLSVTIDVIRLLQKDHNLSDLTELSKKFKQFCLKLSNEYIINTIDYELEIQYSDQLILPYDKKKIIKN